MLIPRYYPVFGGAESQCRSLVAHLRASGRASVPFVLTRRHKPDSAPFEVIDGTPVHRIGRPGLNRWCEYAFYLRAMLILIQRRAEYDIVHCHATSIVGFVATVAARLARRKVLLKLSSNGEFLSGLGNYDGTVRMDPSLRGRARAPLARYMGRHADIVALNDEGARELALGGARRVHRLCNGVDTSRFRPATPPERAALREQQGYSAGDVVFVYTGRFVISKGIDVLLSAVHALATNPAFARARVVLVGSGALQFESVAEELDRLQASIGSRIVVTPATHDVLPFLQSADVFIFPSRREGMPNAVLEALAAGLPCVLSDIAPHKEIATAHDNHTVRLFRSGDAESLAAVLADVALTSEPNSQEARARIAPQFEMPRVAEAYASLYQHLLRPA